MRIKFEEKDVEEEVEENQVHEEVEEIDKTVEEIEENEVLMKNWMKIN